MKWVFSFGILFGLAIIVGVGWLSIYAFVELRASNLNEHLVNAIGAFWILLMVFFSRK